MIIGSELNAELKLVLYLDTQCMEWNRSTYEIRGGLEKEITHYKDLYSALMAPASTVFQDDYAETCEPEHVRATNKCQTRILDANYKATDLK
jgi:hypothetical protein